VIDGGVRAVKPPPGPPAQMSLLSPSDEVSGFVAPDVGSDGSRRCVWCGGPIGATARRDSITCSKPCRQARHRFGKGLRVMAPAETPIALAYADPPYPGKAFYYREHRDYGGEVDHRALLEQLSAYDGWALSTSSRALPWICADAIDLGLRISASRRGSAAPATRGRVSRCRAGNPSSTRVGARTSARTRRSTR
jgi:hypothetical protein